MQGMTAYFTDKIKSTSSYVYNSVSGFTQSVRENVDATISILGDARNFAVKNAGYVAEMAEGYAQGLNPIIHPTILTKPKTRKVLRDALFTNLTYMALVLCGEGVRVNMHQNMQGPWTDWTIDKAANLYFMSLALDNFVSTAMAFASLTTALNDEVLPGANFQPCEHAKEDPQVCIKADIMSTPYYWGKRATVFFISALGENIAWPIRALVYGETLVESKLSSAKLCSDERHAMLATNHAFSLGMGVSMLTTVMAWSGAIQYVTGVQNAYVDDAISNLAFMWYIVAAQMIDSPLPGRPEPVQEPGKLKPKPLPGQRAGLDITYPTREVTDLLIRMTTKAVAPLLSGKKGDLYDKVKVALNKPPMPALRTVLLPASLNSLPAFMQRPASVIFFDLHKPKVLDAIDGILEARQSGKVQAYKWMKHWTGKSVTQFVVDPVTAGLLDNVILHPELRENIKYVKKRLEKFDNLAHPKTQQEIEDEKLDILDVPEKPQAPPAPQQEVRIRIDGSSNIPSSQSSPHLHGRGATVPDPIVRFSDSHSMFAKNAATGDRIVRLDPLPPQTRSEPNLGPKPGGSAPS